jgi:predicted esterase
MSEDHHHRQHRPPRTVDSFIHRFVPSPLPPSPSPSSSQNKKRGEPITLLLLHGTGGNEDDLIPLARELDPHSAILSPRGKVLENGMPRFFRRFAEGVFDVEDLKFRTNELADFVTSASREYEFDPRTVVAVGYSNGANIAASMLLLRPQVISAAILFRAMVPLVPERLPDLSGKSVLLSEGEFDHIVGTAQAEKLKELLQESGANVTLNWAPSDHSLTQEEIFKARSFLQTLYHLGYGL